MVDYSPMYAEKTLKLIVCAVGIATQARNDIDFY